MLIIKIPNNSYSEREYIIKVIFNDFLGIQYRLISENEYSDYNISFNGKELFFRDCFFGTYVEPLSYLRANYIPRIVDYTSNEFVLEDNIPIIFGTNELMVSDKRIFCGIDIFASSYFMLSRWEEHVNKARDNHNRFPAKESLAYKSNFLHRPVVNEYIEMLWNMMLKLGYRGKRKERNFDIILTHDIDELSLRKSLRYLLADLIKRRNLLLFWKHFDLMFISKPLVLFDYLMLSAERVGKKAHFYFISSDFKRKPFEYPYLNKKIFPLIVQEIKGRDHIIGFHPGYYTYDNENRWSYEKRLLENSIGENVYEGRQHYLRMEVIKTLQIWDKNNMKIDSTLGYANKEGFRCGTGDEYHFYDFVNRKTLSLKERPLIIMDTTFQHYQSYSYESANKVIQQIMSIGRKYKTKITLLFHNNLLFEGYKDYSKLLYENVINNMS